MFGILLIDKELGCTSHDVVNDVRKIYGTRRVGHAGTLDPMGSGLLVVAVGPATRFLQYLPLEPKEYEAEITFGIETDSYDSEGEVVREAPVPGDLPVQFTETLKQFSGLIQQLPPMYSAVKMGGKPLYKYARQGQEIEREPRTVHIATIDVLSLEDNKAKIRVICSGGTYIRSLAHDMGQAIGCGAFLSALHRTRVGRFCVEDGVRLANASQANLIPLRDALTPMPMIQLNDIQVAHVREGRQIGTELQTESRHVGLLDLEGNVFSVARVEGPMLQPECVIPSEVVHGTS